jgi:hypothetical protein
MTWYLDVPKILHVYWGGNSIPYLRYLTVKSFKRLNPDWEIILWRPKVTARKLDTWKQNVQNYKVNCKNYLSELLKLTNVQEVDFKDYGISNDMSEVHKSDILRYFLLTDIGGVWSDMDILYFRPITNMAVNKPENRDVESYVCICWYGHSSGFYLARKGSKYFQRMASLAKTGYRANDYLSLGPQLVNDHYPTLKSIQKEFSVMDFGMDAVYAHDCYQMVESYTGGKCLFTEKSIGCHWYAGTQESGYFLNMTDGGRNNLPDNLLGRLLKNINYAMSL